jgi:hypothetical protein
MLPSPGCAAYVCRYFWLNAGILAVGLVIYIFVARSYTEKPILSSEQVRIREFFEDVEKKTGVGC